MNIKRRIPDTDRLYAKTPIGRIEVPEWEAVKLVGLTDKELLQAAFEENKEFCISPATYAMIEKRFLGRELQQMINKNIGFNHEAIKITNNW